MPTPIRRHLAMLLLLAPLILCGCAVRQPDATAIQQRLVAHNEETARAAGGIVRLDVQGQLVYPEAFFEERHRGFIAVMRTSWDVTYAGTCLRPEPAHDHQLCVTANTSQLDNHITAMGVQDPAIRQQVVDVCLLRGWTVMRLGPERIDAATSRMLVPCAVISLGNAMLVDGSRHQFAMSSRFNLSIPVPRTP